MHFEDKVKQENNYYSNKPELAPKLGGILADFSLKPAEYDGPDKANLNNEQQNGFHSILVMAPYSESKNQHLYARILMPTDVSVEFKQKLIEALNSFKDGEPPSVKAAATAAAAAAAAKAAATNPDAASPNAVALAKAPPKPVEIPKPAGYDTAVKLFNEKKWALAQKEFLKFAKNPYEEASTHTYLAYCYYNQRQYTKALAEFSYVVAHSEHNLTLQRSAEAAAHKLRSLMSGICPMDCLKASDPRWRARPDGSKWCRFPMSNGYMEYSTLHIGDIIAYDHGNWVDRGKCPVCGGTGRVAVIHDGDAMP